MVAKKKIKRTKKPIRRFGRGVQKGNGIFDSVISAVSNNIDKLPVGLGVASGAINGINEVNKIRLPNDMTVVEYLWRRKHNKWG